MVYFCQYGRTGMTSTKSKHWTKESRMVWKYGSEPQNGRIPQDDRYLIHKVITNHGSLCFIDDGDRVENSRQALIFGRYPELSTPHGRIDA